MKTVMFAGCDATDRGLLRYARRAVRAPVNMLFERSAQEVIAYLNGDGRSSDRRTYPLPDIVVLDLTKPRLNAWQVVDWLKARPEFGHIHICFIGSEGDEPAVSKAKAHGPCFFTKPEDADCYIELVEALAALKAKAPCTQSSVHQHASH
jgi:CheY-like chemotaxis protein